MVLSQLRFAAGVCVLAAGLLMGAGGAVAVADPGSSGSAAHGTNASGQQHSTGAKKPKDEPDGKDGSLGSGGQSGPQHSTGAKKPKDEPGGTHTKDGTKDDPDLGAAVPDPVAAVPNEVAPVSDAVAPVSDAVAPVSDVVGPVSNVSALVQDMLTSVAGAVVPLTQLQSDLYSFLLGIAGVAPAGDGSGGFDGAGLSAAAGASVASQLPLGPPLAGISGVSVAGNATRVATLDVIALGRASALSGMAPQASNGASPMGAESSFRHVFDELLLIASLWALAADALPGIGGLAILIVVGVRIQYGRLTPDSHREHRALRASPIPRAVTRWMSAR